jgi:multiple antibiotic resistance protein
MIELFLSAFIGLFIIVDPVGTAAIFIGLTPKADKRTRRKIAKKACLIAGSVLIGFGLFGHFLLAQLGISLDAFRIAGGLLIFVSAFRMIMGERSSDSSSNSEPEDLEKLHDLAVFPIAVPLLAGPGCMTTTILLMGNAHTLAHQALVICAIMIVEFLAFIALIGATKVSAFVGKTGNSLLSKLMGVLLAALAVQFIADGILNIVKSAS